MAMPNRRLNRLPSFDAWFGIFAPGAWSNSTIPPDRAIVLRPGYPQGDSVMSMYKPLAIVAATLALAACATVPKPLEGTFNEVSTSGAQQGSASGAKVRWGGEIIKTEPGPQQTCFFVLSESLDSQARPKGGDNQSQGRFVACRDGFYDPEVFTRGREITVTGTVHGAVSQKVGDFDYAYPRVEADVVYLWPKPIPYARYPGGFYDPFWGPGFGPYGYGYGPWGYGGFGSRPYWGGGRRVIVVPRGGGPRPHPHK
jgi:outer membrane lipoprotein